MNNAEKRMKHYLNAVERRLNLPRDIRSRVMHDFCSSIQGRREAGLSDGEIYAELGAPKKVAAELNEQMKDYTYVKSPWRWVFLGLSVLCGCYLAIEGAASIYAYFLTQTAAASIGIIGGADGPTAIFVTASPLSLAGRAAIALAVLLLGILGFRRMSRCKRK